MVYEGNSLRGVLRTEREARQYLEDYKAGKFIIVNPKYSNEPGVKNISLGEMIEKDKKQNKIPKIVKWGNSQNTIMWVEN